MVSCSEASRLVLAVSLTAPSLQDAEMGVDHTEQEVPADAVGRRVACDGERATVRYVGPVPPTAGKRQDTSLYLSWVTAPH